jgi:TonB family protein
MKGVVFAMLLCTAGTVLADETPDTGSGPGESVAIEVFTAPVPKHISVPNCKPTLPGGRPAVCDQIMRGQEGWVELNLMVDPTGRPFEVTVARSSGNKGFEEAAVKAMEASALTQRQLSPRLQYQRELQPYESQEAGSGLRQDIEG